MDTRLTQLVEQPTNRPTRKVAAGAIGSGVIGVPLAATLVGIASASGLALPAGTEAALGALLSSALGYLAAYFTRERL